MKLIVVESPTKAKTLSRFLGKDFSVEATLGHIKDLPKSKLSIDTDKAFAPDYQIKEEREKEIKIIRKEASKAKMVYLATDPDREGEAIAAHVEEILQDGDKKVSSDKIKRIVFHEITKSAVNQAIEKPRKIDKHRVEAQIARRVLDRLVGYKLSPLLWKKVRRGLSAGRVQSVSVRLIVEREREIEKFKPIEYWEIYCDVISQVAKSTKEGFTVKLLRIAGKKAEVNNGKDAKEIVSNLKSSKYLVSDIVKKEVKKHPYPPFTTSTLTQAAARFWGWSAKKTMSVAQKLYERGHITYHRTDSTHLANTAVSKLRKYIEKEFGENYLPEKAIFYKTKSKSAQEAHEAIRPTKVTKNGDGLSLKGGVKSEHKKLYGLIWNRFVACQMAASVYDETRIDVLASSTNNSQPTTHDYLLRASGQVMKFDGWTRLRQSFGGQGKSNEEKPILPNVEKNEKLKLLKINPQQKFTQPPARYNEASLIKTLEKLGIGRPSTYAPIISTIQIRNYVEKDERKFKPTLVGIAVNDFLISNFPKVFDYEFTAGMEDDLDNVATGKRKWTAMMKEFYTPFEKKFTGVEKKAKRVKIETEKLGKKCPTCKKEGRKGSKQGELVIRVGRFGKFVSCSLFPECKHTEKYLEKIGMGCPQCLKEKRTGTKQGDVIVKKTGKGRKFFGCSNYPDCEFASWKDPKLEKKNSEKFSK